MTACFTDHTKLDEHVRDALEMSGSKERFSGVVSKISGTTTWIKSGDTPDASCIPRLPALNTPNKNADGIMPIGLLLASSATAILSKPSVKLWLV